MSTQQEKADRFRADHHRGTPLLLPNVWSPGTARLFESLGFEAVATTSSGHAATLGRLDGAVSRDEALEHAAALVAGCGVPVSCDFENGFADAPDAVAANVILAAATGLAGCSIEDYSRSNNAPIYDIDLAAERVAAAAEAAHGGTARLVLTARAENFLHGHPDLADTIERLQRYQAAGADVLYAPGISEPDDLRRIIASVDLPINVLANPAAPTVAQLGALGVARVSVGGTFSAVALGAVVTAARELLDDGTYGFFTVAASGRIAIRDAFGDA